MTDTLQLDSNKLHNLKRRVHNENFSLRNHLLSILHDSNIVKEIHEFFNRNLKIYANLRNGSWYSKTFDGM
jgi:hypothetical protein